MKFKAKIMDEQGVTRAMTRLSYEIVEQCRELENAVLVGVRTRGVPLAKTIGENILRFTGVELPLLELDVAGFRDDAPASADKRGVLQGETAGKDVILVDDVLYTGRTARAAIEAVLERGRAKRIRFAVLVDRGHRELPVRADFVGKNLPTSRREKVAVKLKETDGETSVCIYEGEESP